MKREKVLILGFGSLAERLAALLAGNYGVTGACRRQKTSAHADLVSADCRQHTDLQPLIAQGFDLLVMTFTPDTITDEGYRRGYVDTVATVLAALATVSYTPRLMLFVSSTSVYGQREGDWVDETSPTVPQHFSGRRLLQAEALLNASPWKSCVVRCSGLYGPGRRRLIEQVIAGKGCEAESAIISNRIHIDDCAGAIAHLIDRQKTLPLADCYLLSDCEPTPLWQVKQWMAAALGLPANHFSDSADRDNSEDNRARMNKRGNKRCCNRRLVSSGYSFIYPSFKEGYTPLLMQE